MSVSALTQIELCPRRWSLEHADYSDRGLGHGFPDRTTVAVVSGRAAHCALERISRAADAAEGTASEAVVVALRTLGGITKVIEDCIDDELARVSTNPRVAPRLEGLEVGLRHRTDELRLLVQNALRLRRLPAELAKPTVAAAARGRSALGYGYHAEVELRPPTLNWIGYADAVRLTLDECEIVDYKTGIPTILHEEQLLVYALLWARDSVINPSGRLADSLLVIYPGGTHRLRPPNMTELAEIESRLATRSAHALQALGDTPPPALVAADTCRFCDVKALCSEYWLPASQERLAVEPIAEYRSLQGIIEREVTASTVSLVIQADPYLAPGTRAVLAHGGRLGGQVGDCLRLLDVRVAEDPEVDTPVVTYGPQSEAFRVP